MLPHHDQQASDDQNQTEHGRMLFSNMLLLNLIPLINVTFSTPTPDFSNYTWDAMKSSYRGWLITSAGLGLLMPMCWFLAQWLFAQAPTFLYSLERVTRVLWPSSIWLMATDGSEGTVSAYEIIVASVTANVVLYAALGSSLWLLKRTVVGRN